MNTNLLTLFASSPTATTPSGSTNLLSTGSSQSTNTSSLLSLGDHLFGQLLASQLQNPKVASAVGQASTIVSQLGQTASQFGQISSQLQTQIAGLLQQGVTMEQIVSTLAQTLGSNFLSQLQQQLGFAPGTSAQTMLTQLLSQALGPPANAPPQTAVQQAGDLVGRLVQAARAVGKAGKVAAGQLLESVGQVSDANAGGTPAPGQIDALLQSALAAVQSLATTGSNAISSATNASGTRGNSTLTAQSAASVVAQSPVDTALLGATPAAAANSAPASGTSDPAAFTLSQAVAQASDGRTVAANSSLSMVGTGGDTTIGRILARAANVAADNTATQAATTAQTTGTALLQPQLAVGSAGSASNGSTNDAMTASLLRTLQEALAAIPAPKDQTATADASSGASTTSSSSLASSILASTVATTIDPAMSSSQAAAPAATQTSSNPNPIDPNGIVDQVLQGISLRNLPDGTQSVQMHLVPESLGNVTVNLQVQNGAVNATLVAQNADVRDTLMANQQLLMRSLQDAGMKLASFTVNVSSNGAQYQQSQNQNQPQFGARRFTSSISDQSDAVAAVPTYGPSQPQLAALQWLNALA